MLKKILLKFPSASFDSINIVNPLIASINFPSFINDGKKSVDDFLMRQVDGDSAFVVDPRCSQLKAAMMGGYRFHKKNGTIDKNKHSHVAEALQYFMLHVGSASDGDLLARRREIKTVSAGGWT